MSLPSFLRTDRSPKVPGAGSGVAIVVESRRPGETVVHGSYRIAAGDRAGLQPGSVRPRVLLFVLAREIAVAWIGRPGAEAVIFSGEEPAAGSLEGWFTVSLEACCRISEPPDFPCDVVAALGPWKSPPADLPGR